MENNICSVEPYRASIQASNHSPLQPSPSPVLRPQFLVTWVRVRPGGGEGIPPHSSPSPIFRSGGTKIAFRCRSLRQKRVSNHAYGYFEFQLRKPLGPSRCDPSELSCSPSKNVYYTDFLSFEKRHSHPPKIPPFWAPGPPTGHLEGGDHLGGRISKKGQNRYTKAQRKTFSPVLWPDRSFMGGG